MTDEEKTYQAYYHPERLWTGGKAIKELHKIMSMSRKNIRSWLAKQALWQFHIPPPIDHPLYDVTKPNEQHSLICFTCPLMFLKGTRTSIYWRELMLHQDTRWPGPLDLKNEAKLHLCWKQSIKRVACLNISRYFIVIMGLSLEMMWQSWLKNTMLIFEGQQRNASIPI